MRANQVLLTLILGASFSGTMSSMALAQESIYELRPPSGVVGTSSTAGMEALVLQISNLELLQVDLVPVLDGSLLLVDDAEDIEAARRLVQDYMEDSAYMLVTAALQLGGTEDSPPSVAPLTTIMLGQIGYVMAITASLDEDPETLYRSIALDPRFPDLLPEVQVAMIGRYVQELILRPNRTTEETGVLAVVDNKAFMTALSELSEVVVGFTDIYEIDWETLEDETILIRYYDERLRLVERTVTGIKYDFRYGLILPPEDEQDPIVRVNLSRIEVVQVNESSTTN